MHAARAVRVCTVASCSMHPQDAGTAAGMQRAGAEYLMSGPPYAQIRRSALLNEHLDQRNTPSRTRDAWEGSEFTA